MPTKTTDESAAEDAQKHEDDDVRQRDDTRQQGKRAKRTKGGASITVLTENPQMGNAVAIGWEGAKGDRMMIKGDAYTTKRVLQGPEGSLTHMFELPGTYTLSLPDPDNADKPSAETEVEISGNLAGF